MLCVSFRAGTTIEARKARAKGPGLSRGPGDYTIAS